MKSVVKNILAAMALMLMVGAVPSLACGCDSDLVSLAWTNNALEISNVPMNGTYSLSVHVTNYEATEGTPYEKSVYLLANENNRIDLDNETVEQIANGYVTDQFVKFVLKEDDAEISWPLWTPY